MAKRTRAEFLALVDKTLPKSLRKQVAVVRAGSAVIEKLAKIVKEEDSKIPEGGPVPGSDPLSSENLLALEGALGGKAASLGADYVADAMSRAILKIVKMAHHIPGAHEFSRNKATMESNGNPVGTETIDFLTGADRFLDTDIPESCFCCTMFILSEREST